MENVDSIGPASKDFVALLLRSERDTPLPPLPVDHVYHVPLDQLDDELTEEEAAWIDAHPLPTVALMSLPTSRRRGPKYLVIISADGLGRGWDTYDLRRRRSAHPGVLLDVLGLDEASEPEHVEVGEEPRRAPPPLHLRALTSSTLTAAPPAAPAVHIHAGAST